MTPASLTIAQQLKQTLRQGLEPLGQFESCALLNYPNYGNIGDHLIGLGTIIHLTEVVGTRIAYCASIDSFDRAEMDRKIGEGTPILMQGGGNFGDIWYEHQKFREDIIRRYPKNPIVILPQTIYFTNEGCLKEARKAFRDHPNLTIFCRDTTSFEFAQQQFGQHHLHLCTDMAFALADMPGLSPSPPSTGATMYMRRKDKELNQGITPELLGTNLVIEDWESYNYRWMLDDVVEAAVKRKFFVDFGRPQSVAVRGLATLIREGWQRGLSRPQERAARRQWLKDHPYRALFQQHDHPHLYELSLSLIHSGMYQFAQYPRVVTSRLHGHILSLLMGIPHIFLPNSYHKNTKFYENWTHIAPFCEFVDDDRQLRDALAQLEGRAAA